MKKSLFALAAVGAFAGAAQAQSSVSVYGIMDGSYTASEVNSTTTAGVKSTYQQRNTVNGDGALSTSRLGFRGVEDLGGGMKANFNLEYDLVNIGTGGQGNTNAAAETSAGTSSTANGFGARLSFIGIEGGFGQFRIGRQESNIHATIASNLAGGANNVLGSLYSSGDAGSTMTTAGPGVRPHSVYVNQALTFISPTFAGATITVQTSKNAYSASSSTPSAGASQSGASIAYTGVKNLRLDAGMIVENVVEANLRNVKRTTKAIGGNYDFGIAQVFALHTQNKFENLNSNETLSDTKLTEVGVKAPVTKVIGVWGNYFTGNRNNSLGTSTTMAQATGNTAALAAADIKGFQLGTTYAFSKRTTAYGIYGTQQLDGKSAANGAKLDGTMYAVGLRHTF
jgi:predicted porin